MVSCNINSDWPSIYDGVIEYPFEPEKELKISALDIDGEYSAHLLFGTYGVLEVSKRVNDPSEETLKEVLLELQETVNSAHGPEPACVGVELYSEDRSITVKGFPYDQIGTPQMENLVANFVNRWLEFQLEYDQVLNQK